MLHMKKDGTGKMFPAGNCLQCMKYCTVVNARITFIIIYCTLLLSNPSYGNYICIVYEVINPLI